MYRKLAPDSKWLVFDNNPIMHQEIKDLRFPLTIEDEAIILKMQSYIDASFDGLDKKYKIQAGIGIAAIQLGYPKKIIYIRLMQDKQEKKYLLANPVKVGESVKKMYLDSGEGCLSVKAKHEGYSIRKACVIVKGISLYDNQEITVRADGLLAACFQHELDHNNNMFYYQRINPEKPFYCEPDWIKLTR